MDLIALALGILSGMEILVSRVSILALLDGTGMGILVLNILLNARME